MSYCNPICSDDSHDWGQYNSVILTITSRTLSGQEIQKAISFTPTEIIEKGAPNDQEDFSVHPMSWVNFEIPVEPKAHTNDHLEYAEKILRDHKQELLALPSTCSLCIFIRIEPDQFECGIVLPPSFLQICGEIGISVSVVMENYWDEADGPEAKNAF